MRHIPVVPIHSLTLEYLWHSGPFYSLTFFQQNHPPSTTHLQLLTRHKIRQFKPETKRHHCVCRSSITHSTHRQDPHRYTTSATEARHDYSLHEYLPFRRQSNGGGIYFGTLDLTGASRRETISTLFWLVFPTSLELILHSHSEPSPVRHFWRM